MRPCRHSFAHMLLYHLPAIPRLDATMAGSMILFPASSSFPNYLLVIKVIYIYTCNIIGLQISNPFSRIWFWFQTIIFWVPGRVFLLGRIFMNLLSGVDPSQGSTGFIAFNELVACTSEYGRLGYPKQYSKRYQTQYPKGYPIKYLLMMV